MKTQLTVRNLMATHYENPDHVLEFDADGQRIFVTVRGLGPVDDEFYWDDEDNLARALAEVKEDDIEEQLIEKPERVTVCSTREMEITYFASPEEGEEKERSVK